MKLFSLSYFSSSHLICSVAILTLYNFQNHGYDCSSRSVFPSLLNTHLLQPIDISEATRSYERYILLVPELVSLVVLQVPYQFWRLGVITVIRGVDHWASGASIDAPSVKLWMKNSKNEGKNEVNP